MAKALLYPGADRSRWFGDNFDGRIFTDLDKLLLHSTETPKNGGCPGYSNGAVAPTLTVNPWPGYRKVWQHFNLNESARALMNPTSTAVSENKDNVCQIEIIGYSDKGYGLARGCYLPNLDADSRQWLAEVMAFIMREWSIPNVWAAPFPWPIYPASYGNTSSRMTSTEYDAFTGVLGHLHASGNNHGDPSLPVADLKARVAALLTTEEDDMFTDEDRALLRDTLKRADGGQLRADIGHARDQIRGDLGVVLSATDPTKLAAALAPALAAALPAADVVSQDDLESALRKVLGSVDGVSA